MSTSNIKDLFGCFGAIIMLGFIVVMIFGYVYNIIKLCSCDFTTIEAIEVVRIIGCFIPPVGMVAGYC